MSASAAEPTTLGSALRAVRRQRGLSLSDLAAATAISASFLSLVENGKSDITIGRLTRLVEFYGISIADLLPAPPHASTHIVRHEEMQIVHSPAEGIDLYLAGSDRMQAMAPMYLHFEPGARLAELGRHPGEEWLYVLSGELLLEVEGEQPAILRAGDSAHYLADRPHRFENNSDLEPLTLVCVDSPPSLR